MRPDCSCEDEAFRAWMYVDVYMWSRTAVLSPSTFLALLGGLLLCPLRVCRPLSLLPPNKTAQAFSCYVHLAVIRLFVESILRYGLPPQFQAAVVKPLPKMEARLRAVLLASFGTGGCWRAACLVTSSSTAVWWMLVRVY